jgi:uncharacterized membrane-anchored protein
VEKALAQWRQEQEARRVLARMPWQAGPRELVLADAVRLALPRGFQFLDDAGVDAFHAALHRRRAKAADFETRLGMVGNADHTCLGNVILLRLGPVDGAGEVPADQVLAELNGHRGGTAQAWNRVTNPDAPFIMPATIGWLLPPTVDRARHTLEWARNGDPSLGEHDLYTFVLLGGQACLLMEFPNPPDRAGMEAYRARLRPLLEAAAFLPGRAYEDHPDRKGRLTLRDLVRGPMTALEAESAKLERPPDLPGRKPFWALLVELLPRIVTTLGLIGFVYAGWRARKRRPAQKAPPAS